MQAFLEKYTRLQVDHAVFGNSDLFQLILSYLDAVDLSECTHVNFHWRTVIYSNPYMEISILKFRLSMTNRTVQKLKKKEKPPPKPKPGFFVPSFDVNQQLQASLSRIHKAQGQEKAQYTKWKNFIENFYEYAKEQAFPIHEQSNLSNKDWNLYSSNLEKFINTYVEEVMNGKNPQPKPQPKSQLKPQLELTASMKPANILDRRMTCRIDYKPKEKAPKPEPVQSEDYTSIFKSLNLRDVYNNLKDDIHCGFHLYTGFKYFDAEKEVMRIKARKEVPLPIPQSPIAKSKGSQDIDLNCYPI